MHRRLAGPSRLGRRTPAARKSPGSTRPRTHIPQLDRCLLAPGATRSGCFVLLGVAGAVARLRVGQGRGIPDGTDTAVLRSALQRAVALVQSFAGVDLVECQVVPEDGSGVAHTVLVANGFTPCSQWLHERPLADLGPELPALAPEFRLAPGVPWAATQLCAAGYTEYEAFLNYPWQHLELSPWAPAEATRLVQETLRRPDFCAAASAAILQAGAVVAIILVTRPAADQGFVAELAVRRAYQGQGLGLALLSHAHATLRQMGCRTVRLHVAADFPAGPFYQRCGYRVVRRTTTYRWRRGVSPTGGTPVG